ncbi:MAG TPA: vitamin B12-dependent ribonucleotide reductase, partial [Candidatus Krumholzibacteria bacterium]|nr:vitamin B12-dependent ribonucleotide reductase [Candidatus Krumholzibacteria bacterium]
IQQLSACFVLPVEDSMDAIFDSIKHTALIHKSGGGTGFSFSRLRPRNDEVCSTHGVSSGPISFMGVFDAATDTIRQGGRRRGANMAILRIDHPDILEFIDAKQAGDRLNNFNLSVAVTDEFMRALAEDREYALVNPRTGSPAGQLRARDVMQKIVDGAWRNGEPGIVYIDRMNADNPTPAVGDIESTNPCGEQPLLPYESCNLGSINLPRFAEGDPGSAHLDVDRLRDSVALAVRFLDDVIDMNRYPLPQIEALTQANRKIGLGVMGFAELLVRMGVVYDSPEAERVAADVMQTVQDAAVEASRQLARERGAFPNFAGSCYAADGEAPRRNATVTTIAPTGSISIIAGTSSGIEPLFAVAFKRRVLDGAELVDVNPLFEEIARSEGFYSDELVASIAQHGTLGEVEGVPDRWRKLFQTAHEITPRGHIRIQAAFQHHTENAVSKTVNFAASATPEDVEAVFREAHASGCKGVTVYRDGSRAQQVLSTGTETPAHEHAPKVPRPRPEVVTGRTTRMETGCGNLYVTTNETTDGPFELFAQIGKAGGCAASQTEAIGRLVSLSLRSGVDAGAVARQLRGVRCPYPSWNRGNKVLSCADGIGQALARLVEDRGEAPASGNGSSRRAELLAGSCPECGNELEFESGCAVCRSCGYSRC